jgi:2,3-dihydroxybenzoate decarboxylase
MLKKLALEEHFLSPGLIDYWTPTVAELDRGKADMLFRRVTDFGEQRLAAMDAAGIERAVLGIAGPGVQAEGVIATAVRKAKESNDYLAREIQARPDRFLGFAHLAMQDPAAAADELERCVKELQFCGAMINGHTNGVYLDDPIYDVFWERAEALEAPVYLHPNDPVVPAPVLNGYQVLRRATWEWGFETGSHALRLIFGGVFDRFPRARLVLGHLGETLPYLLWRFDSRAGPGFYDAGLKKLPSQYLKDNLWVTISGMLSAEPLYCAISALGPDRVMFASDYPFEDAKEAGHFLDTVRLEEGLRTAVAFRNAERLFNL